MKPVKMWGQRDVGSKGVVDTREESRMQNGAIQHLIGGLTLDTRVME